MISSAERSSELYALLENALKEDGFPVVGGVDIAKAASRLAEHAGRFDRWLAAGFAGTMGYLPRGRDRRADPTKLLPGAKSILCVGVPYELRPGGSTRGPRFARYLAGRDYHLEIAERLEWTLQRCAQQVPFAWKTCVDTSAMLERGWAEMAGLGWIGKNSMLIHPKLGSFLFLAEVLLDQELDRGLATPTDLCGHCARCLESCPTGAIIEPRTIDSTKCTSYLTLEKRKDFDVSEGLRERMGTWIAGCDICQEVCPFNHKPLKCAPKEPWAVWSWDELLEESPERYAERMRESALERVKPEMFDRNLANAFLNALKQDAQGLKALRPLAEKRARAGSPIWQECLQLLSEA